MSLSGIFKKASHYILGSQNESQQCQFTNEGEIIFCKNNVCVHPPTMLRQDTDIIHHPGYLTLTCQTNSVTNRPTLMLAWIPNQVLRGNPATVEQRSLSASRCGDKRRQSTESISTPDSYRHSSADSLESHSSVPNSDWLREIESRLKRGSLSSDNSIKSPDENKPECCESVPNIVIDTSPPCSLDSVSDTSMCERRMSASKEMPAWMVSPEVLAQRHNLTFPDSATASPVVRRAYRTCRKFSVDLSEMRSLRLFFSDASSTQGQLVVASRQCQYKILHFHHGGLDRLANTLQAWNLLTVQSDTSNDDAPYRHFMVCRPAVSESDLHPEEGTVSPISSADWVEMLNCDGQLEDDVPLRKGIFLGGLSPDLRKTVWPFLLHFYSFQSTYAEREHILQRRRLEYHQINCRRESLEGAARERFTRNITCVVEKDVVRTDRSHPYYAGDSNPHVQTMMRILLNYAVYNASLGYTQGMSDLLAPVLAEIETESDAFWCFVGLMQRGMFVCTPTDSDMERNLNYLRELIREMVPEFYTHLQKHTDAMELLFCHRWILLCFKREFPEPVVLRIWEACWSNYLTDYFHLFLCLAIVSAYADDVIAQCLRTDEMLLHFSSLAMFMDGDLILRKARGLVYKFRERPVIPCTLVGLCQLCGTGMWDSSHVPTVVCRGNSITPCPQDPCPYRGITTNGE
ncbi:TBC1 domain family member 16-like isoform X1 [Macrosteles quadrilineatus]|uniref:TBC1 domain family member 16-like isoform X1 n=2 Tax=Macrosteles quadrilineatus TaxID=74068 RepID=UPI0023E11039|nr:TBC1 domain family member 16-like isoform X1 [Macrosteles quadrilineatus]